MLVHRAIPQARFASCAYYILLLVFAAAVMVVPTVGLAGLGTLLILGAVLVEANRSLIWKSYQTRHRKLKGPRIATIWVQPLGIVYWLNVWVVWPLVFAVGIAAIYAAFITASA